MTQRSDPTPGAASGDGVRIGMICGIAAYAMWGLFPLYLKPLDGVSSFEVVAHRIVWSVPVGALILTLRHQWRDVRIAFASVRVLTLLASSSLIIALNWLIYVWAVNDDRVLEASLGYYINPLMFVAAGVFVLKERLNRIQITAVCLATLGVMALGVGAGAFPWVSLLLAVSFTAYGFIRKTTAVGAMPGLFIETVLLSPFAVAFLLWLARSGTLAFGASGQTTDLLLLLAGPITVGPLLFFAIAARRLRMSTLGFLQYIGPTGQFLLGLHYGEAFTPAHAVCFGLIWLALALISVDAIRRNRSRA